MKNSQNKLIRILRWGLLALFTVLITIASYLHITLGGGKSPSIHALCPYGGLESLYQLFTAGTFISKIFSGTLILFGITLMVALLFRRSFCGVICPFGAIQEFFALLGKKVFGRRFELPLWLDRPLRYLKYGVLVVTVFYAWQTAGLWMAPYDPWAAYAHLPEGLESVWSESAVGLILLGITVLGSLLYDRFFCKYLCPMGAIYAIIGKLSPFKVVRNDNLCIDCGTCNRVCPMNIDVQHSMVVDSAECINCSLCVLDCPKAGALENKISKKTVTPFLSIVLVIILFFGSIFAAQAAGIYPLLPEQPKAGVIIPYSDIKGYMSIQDAAKATNTALPEFYKKFGIPETVPDTTLMKRISEIVPSFDFDGIKGTLAGAPGISTNPSMPSISPVNVDAVTGAMTIRDAASTVSLDLSEFYTLFKIPEKIPPETAMRDIGNFVPEYDFHAIKMSLE